MHDPSSLSAAPSHKIALVPIPYWSANTHYQPGAVVWYGGSYWRCERPHLSDTNGQPDNNLHLWTPISSTSPFGLPSSAFTGPQSSFNWASIPNSSGAGPSSTQPSNQRGQAPLFAPVPSHPSDDTDETHSDDSSPDSQCTITATDPDPSGSKRSYTGMTTQFFSSKADEGVRFLTAKQEGLRINDVNELRDELKGKRVWRVGGVGMWAYDQSPEGEEIKAGLWREWQEKYGMGREGWLAVARDRTEFYNQTRGIKPLITWKLVQPGSPFPRDALQIGHEGSGQPLFSARAFHEGGLHLGKAGPHLHRGCSISYGGGEVYTDTFEVLCGKPDPTMLKWMCFQHGESVCVQGWQPVEGGREKDGQSLFVAKGEWEGGQHPGKCRIPDDHAHVGWGGGEVWIRPFYVLAYATSRR